VSGEAHLAHLPSVSLEWDESYLRDLAASDPEAIHVRVRDQAGFHLRAGDPRLPERVRIIDRPPYSPELNPCEQLWDISQRGHLQPNPCHHPCPARGDERPVATLLGGRAIGAAPGRARLAPGSTKRYAENSGVCLI